MIGKGAVTPEEALSYAMSLPVAVTISGVDTLEVLHQNLAVARGFQPLATSAHARIARALPRIRRRWASGAYSR